MKLQMKLYTRALMLRDFIVDEGGQDLIEYALVAGLIALAATAGMTGVAGKISTAFTNIGTKLNTYTS